MAKKVRAVVAHKETRYNIYFRAFVTVLEVVAAVLVALPPELVTGDKIAVAAAIGGLISVAINVIKESGVVSDGT